MLRVLSVIGARPQFIKAAVVSRELKKHSDISERLIHTGQHYDQNMSEIFFSELGIPEPDKNLEIAVPGHAQQTAEMVVALDAEMKAERPDIVLIYGDTNSTLAAALAAAKLHIPLAHVEAGLRSFNKKMPEEINRIVADHCSSLLFSVSSVSTGNLKQEGISESIIVEAGDVMFDAVRYYSEMATEKGSVFNSLGLINSKFALATIHRQENTDYSARLNNIFEALIELSDQLPVVLPLHPRTRKVLDTAGLLTRCESKLTITEPLGYFDMLLLQKNASVVITDSGGLQKEAYYLATPCVTLRDETEWTELLEQGYNKLISPSQPTTTLVSGISSWIERGFQPKTTAPLYGGGKAGPRIAEALRKSLVK